ncbi:MAG: carboxypeptidase-like regulatory domain-containing protein [Parvibaculaceae bacterium]|nr:carboxypeptidase-like regulatory domain-containing protein [Parvibaculaceae bacterium]
MHSVLNQDLGLPISDSVFVQSARGSPEDSAFFRSIGSLHHASSRYFGHSIVGLLIREWHRGNIDQVHSWTNDTIPQFRFVLPEAVPLSAELQVVQLPAVNFYLATAQGYPEQRGYQQLRLMFNVPPPDDLRVFLNFADDTRINVDDSLLERARGYQDWRPGQPYAITLFLNTTADLGIVLPPDAASRDLVHNLVSIDLQSDVCETDCGVALLAVERDNYNRATALIQREFLKSMNIRPLLYTSHGGYTKHQSYGVGRQTTFSTAPDHFRQTGDFLADQEGSHAYISDVLRDLGVHSISSLDSPTTYAEPRIWYQHPAPNLVSNYRNFYALARTYGSAGAFTRETARQQARMVLETGRLDPDLIDVSEYFCTTSVFCYDLHMGSQVGFNLYTSLETVRDNRSVEHLWYQHFGVSAYDPELQPTIADPWAPTALRNFRSLSDHYYNFSGAIPPEQRVWVAAAAQWQTYRIMSERLAQGGAGVLRVDPETSSVEIRSSRDPVTDRVFPDPLRGTGDLQGITIYVPDARKAQVTLDDRPVRTFTRNPADGTGQQSVTLVGDNTPTVLIDEIDPVLSGAVAGERIQFSMESGSEAAYGASYLRLTAVDTVEPGQFVYQPGAISSFNTSHLHFALRKQAEVRVRLSFEMEDGDVIVAEELSAYAVEGPGDVPSLADAGWFFSVPESQESWEYITLSLDRIGWASPPLDRESLPLPIGRIKEIRVEVVGPGSVDIDGLMMLSPTVHAEAEDRSKLVAGRVTQNGLSVSGATVTLTIEESGRRRSVATDPNGYYYFPHTAVKSVVSVQVEGIGEGACKSPRGVFGIYRNEAEVDIDIENCVDDFQQTALESFP